VSLNKREDFDF